MQDRAEERRNKRRKWKEITSSVKQYGISQVSKIYNISRETMMRWIRRFKEGGVNAFAWSWSLS